MILQDWLKQNRLENLESIANPLQLEPFQVLPLYTRENFKRIAVPYLPPEPFFHIGLELNNYDSKTVRYALEQASSVLYFTASQKLPVNEVSFIDFSIIKSFFTEDSWNADLLTHVNTKDVVFYVSEKNIIESSLVANRISAEVAIRKGASKSQELALMLFDYIQASEKYPSAKFYFEFFNDNDFVLDICKIRAFRYLYAKICHLSGRANDKIESPYIHIRFHPLFYSLNEPWMNVKRQTTAAFSALCANANSMSLAGFDQRDKLPAVPSSRLAINIQHILKEESHLWDVYDPSKGSYLFETITAEFAEATWSIVQSLLQENYDTKTEIQKVAEKRLQAYQQNQLDLVGTTIHRDKNFKSPTASEDFLDSILEKQGLL